MFLNFLLNLTFGHEVWIMNKRTVTKHSLRVKVRSSILLEELRAA